MEQENSIKEYPKFEEIKIEDKKEDIMMEESEKKETNEIPVNNTSQTEENTGITFYQFESLLHKSWLIKLANKEDIFDIIKCKKNKNTTTPKKEKVVKEKTLKPKTEKVKKPKVKKSKAEKLDNNDKFKVESSVIKEDINVTSSEESENKRDNKDHELVDNKESDIENINIEILREEKVEEIK